MSLTIGWPQGILLAMMGLALCIAVQKHGQPRSPYNFNALLVAVSIELVVLWWGGFFGH